MAFGSLVGACSSGSVTALATAAAPDGGAAAGHPEAPPRRPPLPPEPVHAYPPHAIRSDGVGPYRLGMDIKDVLRELPEGPHVELLQVSRIANWRIVRSEGADLIVGADPKGLVAFVGVLGAEVARTQAGVGVGVTTAELVDALGVAEDPGDIARDRRILELPALPGVRFLADGVTDKAKIVAVLVEESDPPLTSRPPSVCRTGGPLAGVRADALVAARGKGAQPIEPAQLIVRFGCVTAAAPEAVVVGADEITLVAGEPGRLRRLGGAPAPGAEIVGALDVDGDGKDEIVWAAQRRSDSDLTLEVHVLHWEGGRLVEVLAQKPVSIGVDAAAAAGATPAQIDLAVEMRADRGALVVGGIYVTRVGGRLRELAPMSPMSLKLTPPKGPNGDAP